MTQSGKCRLPDSSPGFSLGAWIAVIASFLIFAVLVYEPRPPNRHSAQRTSASIKALAQALDRYESEYDKIPEVHALDLESEGPEAVQLIMILLGKEEPESNMQNPRQLPLLIIQISKNKKRGGLVYSDGNKAAGIYDAWGNPLRIILRPPGQMAITLPYRGKEVTISAPAAVLSRGPDGKWATKDDLTSWDLL